VEYLIVAPEVEQVIVTTLFVQLTTGAATIYAVSAHIVFPLCLISFTLIQNVYLFICL